MIKTFRELLAEKDDEYTYFIRSTADIHRPELFERIRLSVLPYGIKSFETDTYKPIGKMNKSFPDEPNSPTYSIKVVTSLKIPKGFKASLAMDAHIHVAHLRIDGDGDVELVNQPEEVTSGQAQEMVGQKRIAAFIKELEQDRKRRKGITDEREVYEGWCTTHRGVEDLVKKPMRKGYYTIEAFRENGKNYLRADGPFEARPAGLYHDRIRATGTSIVTETSTSERYGVQVMVEDVEAQ